MRYSIILCLLLFTVAQTFSQTAKNEESGIHDLVFTQLPGSWDEGIPLGNGMLGALIWQKDGKLRFSLDRADLWDLRPMENLHTDKFNFNWVFEQWKNDTYKNVQNQFDKPYDQLPAPTKIPGGALEFDIQNAGKVKSVSLHIQEAVCEVIWEDGKRMQSFVHATKQAGWFRFQGFDENIVPELVPPVYQGAEKEKEAINSVTGQNLSRLGYKQGALLKNSQSTTYTQKGWGGFEYQIHVSWEKNGKDLVGCWSISSVFPGWEKTADAASVVASNLQDSYEKSLSTHTTWWNLYWGKAAISIPDPVLEKQWYLEMYKFGAAARSDAPPISLQAVWTADNGKIPPWKGDFHHDLNTQLSYWPAYSGNQLDLEEGYINWLWKYRDTFKKYTKDFYGTDGLNVPGVTTLTGEPLGGWVQYSFGPTVSAWLGHHFYLHWRYTMDSVFLAEKAYPWISDVATFFDEFSVKDENGMRKLPLSSSPEIFNNDRKAWFDEITNYDLALIRWTYTKAAELAVELNKTEEAAHWKQALSEWPDFAVDEVEGLKFSQSVPYFESHRHFSHLMAIHPLGLIDISNGAIDKAIIEKSIINLDKKGPSNWCGYSYSWEGNIKARAKDGDGAMFALRIFADAFCLPNSFHANGDQTKKGYSNFTYRPFTLEGNFAFASGINEMLIQSHTGTVRVFPAIPVTWKNVSFSGLRTEGAFLVSATTQNRLVKRVEIVSEKGGTLRLENPFGKNKPIIQDFEYKNEGDVFVFETKPGESIIIRTDP